MFADYVVKQGEKLKLRKEWNVEKWELQDLVLKTIKQKLNNEKKLAKNILKLKVAN